MKVPKAVRIFEVGPRDGLQNEARILSLGTKIRFINELAKAGAKDIEVGAFVRRDLVPQMSHTQEIYKAIKSGKIRLHGARTWSLVPNLRGLEDAIEVGATGLAVFTASSDTFVRKNIGMSREESLRVFGKVIEEGVRARIRMRAYLSTAFYCPFEGKVSVRRTLRMIEKLLVFGAFQVSVGDTIGMATPRDVEKVLAPAIRNFGGDRLAGHFHDTRGAALANSLCAMDLGIQTLDSSAGGLGGCPFAPGASGNLATEDLVFLLNGMGVRCGIDIQKLTKTSLWLARAMRRKPTSKYVQSSS